MAKKRKTAFYFRGLDGKDYRLTPKQRMFADHFLTSLNGVQSVKKVYATNDPNTAANIASDNLRKPNIVAYLSMRLEKVGISVEETMGHLGYLVRQFQDLSAKGKGIDMALKVFSKYGPQKVEHGISDKLQEFLDKQSKRLP